MFSMRVCRGGSVGETRRGQGVDSCWLIVGTADGDGGGVTEGCARKASLALRGVIAPYRAKSRAVRGGSHRARVAKLRGVVGRRRGGVERNGKRLARTCPTLRRG
jgi:hypothetical protein